MGLASWALSPHSHSQTWPWWKTADTGQACPNFRETLFPDSLTSQVHHYAQVCLGISSGRVLGWWLQALWKPGVGRGHGHLWWDMPMKPLIPQAADSKGVETCASWESSSWPESWALTVTLLMSLSSLGLPFLICKMGGGELNAEGLSQSSAPSSSSWSWRHLLREALLLLCPGGQSRVIRSAWRARENAVARPCLFFPSDPSQEPLRVGPSGWEPWFLALEATT